VAQSVLNVRMDEDVKKALEDFCSDVGMNVSVAVNLFAKAVIREQRIPFDISAQKPRVLNATTIAAIEETEAGIGLRREKDLNKFLAELKED